MNVLDDIFDEYERAAKPHATITFHKVVVEVDDATYRDLLHYDTAVRQAACCKLGEAFVSATLQHKRGVRVRKRVQ